MGAVGEGPPEEVPFEQKEEKEPAMGRSEKRVPGRRTTHAKALRWESTKSV